MICSQNDIKVYEDFQLTNFNTLKINSTAKSFYLPDNYGELITLLKKFKDTKPFILGNGSNILFSSNGIDIPVIYTGRIKAMFAIGKTLTVEAGVKTQALSKYAQQKKRTGFEFLIGIPATLGGAIYMNAGAHGQTISDCIISAKVYDTETKKTRILKKDELGFGYRTSIFKKEPLILLEAKFEFKKADENEISQRMEENLAFRKNRQPNLALPNCGSVFKNPTDCEFSAGALIDKCGFRGYKLGGVQVYENHCNFIINNNCGTSSDYINLMFEIYQKVKKEFNVELAPEVIYVGKMSESEEEKWKILTKQN